LFEKEDGSWELIDGLQRVSTILEFMGKLRDPNGALVPPSILEATKYLPSLYNSVWERSELIADVPLDQQREIDKSQQLSIRRARIGLEILKRPSDDQTKFDLFQRLNAGGTQANAQELRNCIMIMVNGTFFRAIKSASEQQHFQRVTAVTDDQIERQRHMELAVRFLVHANIPYDGMLDVEEYIDEGIVQLASASNGEAAADLINRTFALLDATAGGNALRRYEWPPHRESWIGRPRRYRRGSSQKSGRNSRASYAAGLCQGKDTRFLESATDPDADIAWSSRNYSYSANCPVW
jgi:hypothetical protein